MLLRLLITSVALACSAQAGLAAAKPYRVSLVGDGFDGTSWHSGVLVELDPGWKTYWRMPGDAGIPPEFTWSPSAPAEIEVSFPTPSRHSDKSGEAIGYAGQVLFPVRVTPAKPGALDLSLDMFFAVCKDICIPAEAKASIKLDRQERDPLGSVRAEAARAMVPAAGSAISGAKVTTQSGAPVLELSLREKPQDIFVETAGSAYFRAPVFAADGGSAQLPIDNLHDPAKLRGQALRITYLLGGKGYEQSLTLP